MAITDWYVDPSLGSDTGSGTIGSPWGRASGSVIQWAISTGITTPGTNGDRINCKSGATDSLGGTPLSVASYGTPSNTQPLIIQGYGSAQGDGTRGALAGGGGAIQATAHASVSYVDMDLSDGGSATLLNMGAYGSVLRCIARGTTGRLIQLSTYGRAIGCHLYNGGNYGLYLAQTTSFAAHNYIESGPTNQFSYGLVFGYGGFALNNIFDMSGATGGRAIGTLGYSNVCIGNSIYQSGGTVAGIDLSTYGYSDVVMHNIVRGYDGTGGVGLKTNATEHNQCASIGNAVYQCTSDYSPATQLALLVIDDESLSAEPFADAGNMTFATRFATMEPVATGNLHAAWPETGG